MRVAFVKTIEKLASENPNIMLLTGDLGYSVFENFIKQFPKQYLNCGVAEQNMTGVAAGMAMEGKIPIIFSIIPFVTMRNFEQIRIDICYQNLNVKIVGVGAGFSYGPYGHTHYGLEDIGILRTLPNLTIFAPGDPIETNLVTNAALDMFGPAYIRLGRAGESVVHIKKPLFKIGKAIILSKGHDVTIISTSTMLYTASQVLSVLKKRKISVNFVSMPTIKPIDQKLIIRFAKQTKILVTLEEHSIIGGLGSAIAEIIAENKIDISFKRIGVADNFTKVMGTQAFMRETNNLSVNSVVKTIQGMLT